MRLSRILPLALIALSLTPSAGNATQAREVELSDARRPPTRLAYLMPGEARTYARGIEGWNCRDRTWFSDVSAYHWDGSALGPQRFNRRTQVMFWRSVRGRVTFDGITFRNRTDRPVLVAGWCEN